VELYSRDIKDILLQYCIWFVNGSTQEQFVYSAIVYLNRGFSGLAARNNMCHYIHATVFFRIQKIVL